MGIPLLYWFIPLLAFPARPVYAVSVPLAAVIIRGASWAAGTILDSIPRGMTIPAIPLLVTLFLSVVAAAGLIIGTLISWVAPFSTGENFALHFAVLFAAAAAAGLVIVSLFPDLLPLRRLFPGIGWFGTLVP